MSTFIKTLKDGLGNQILPRTRSSAVITAGGDSIDNYITNRNLLDNSFFQVNQRGVTTWTSGYGVDRWYATEPMEISNGALIFNNSSVFQKIENESVIDGKVLTFSIKKSDGSIIGGTTTFHIGQDANFYVDDDIAILYNSYWSGFQIYVPGSATIVAAKLELGSVSTLANDIAPNYAEELLKCQRYALVLSDSAGVGHIIWESTALITVPLPNKLRTSNPTISVKDGANNAQLRIGTLWELCNAVILNATGNNSLCLLCSTGSSSLENDTCVDLHIETKLIISSDL